MEDNELIRENITEMLDLANYKTYAAENGKVGVEIALREHPDLIVCDVMMPVLDGYGALHLLSKNDSTKNIPFIFLTSKADKADIRKGMELGADDYITKPFDNVELLNSIDRRLKKVEALKQEITSGISESLHLADAKSSDESLMEFINGRNSNKYKRKQQIFLEGNRPIYLFYVLKGMIKTFKRNDYGKELVLDLYKKGDFLGQVSLLENTNYKETAEALEETEVALIPRDEFESLINNSPQVSRKFIQMLAKNVTEKEEQLLGLAYNSLRKRVAETLLLLHKKYGGPDTGNFSIDINRNNLANIAGVAKESFIRTLREFKDEKLIDIKEGIIVIINKMKLETLLN